MRDGSPAVALSLASSSEETESMPSATEERARDGRREEPDGRHLLICLCLLLGLPPSYGLREEAVDGGLHGFVAPVSRTLEPHLARSGTAVLGAGREARR